jgi:hypothetical protein
MPPAAFLPYPSHLNQPPPTPIQELVVVWLKDTSVTATVTLAATSVAVVVDDLRVDNQLPVGLSEVAVRRKDAGSSAGGSSIPHTLQRITRCNAATSQRHPTHPAAYHALQCCHVPAPSLHTLKPITRCNAATSQ